MTDQGPEYSPFFAVMGATAAMVFSGNYHISHLSYLYVTICCCTVFANPFCICITQNRGL